ncbi:hypothetical protein P691DRAFT_811646 [Macrolepiota fuliginosa MF-IS2]|uniref:Uncharacterized protein n=1 Tax=Macrolepiota fuliginosa MF-IS2 TaxID=1400762 RepID=A0A9P6BXQ7_9AGAR|nr:hypothetical protein P691DRAFT_811646 [Macrolepiota fuliginosa MF-IS2]
MGWLKVGVNSADNTPQAIRIIQMAMRNEERKREAAEMREREAAEEGAKKLEEETRKREEETKKLEEGMKKLEEETRRREEETRRREEETRRREEAEEKAKEYEKILQRLGVLPYPMTQHGNARPESPTTPSGEVDEEEISESPAA